MSWITDLSYVAPALACGLALLAITIVVLMRAARRERSRQRANWRRYLIRHRVLRDLGSILWGPPRLPDLRDRHDERP